MSIVDIQVSDQTGKHNSDNEIQVAISKWNSGETGFFSLPSNGKVTTENTWGREDPRGFLMVVNDPLGVFTGTYYISVDKPYITLSADGNVSNAIKIPINELTS